MEVGEGLPRRRVGSAVEAARGAMMVGFGGCGKGRRWVEWVREGGREGGGRREFELIRSVTRSRAFFFLGRFAGFKISEREGRRRGVEDVQADESIKTK